MTLTTHRGFAPATLTEAMQFSEHLASSSMVPKAYQGKPADILVCVQWGYEIGLAPMQALQNIAVINGKPSVYGDAALALVQASPLCEGIDEHIENEGTPNPSAVCIARRKGRMPVIARFSVEEAQDYPADEPRKMRDITPTKPANPLDAIAPPAPPPPVEVEPVVQTSDPIVIAEQMADTVEQLVNQAQEAGIEIVEVETITEEELEREAIIAESGNPPRHPGFALMVPGREEPLASYPTIEGWYEAYEALADKTARAGRAAARTRMTKLRELREANEGQLGRLPLALKPIHMAKYNQRLAALGATLTPEERAAESGQAAA